MDLIADIGATNTRCGLVDGNGVVVAIEHFENKDFPGVFDVLTTYMSRRRESDKPRAAALAVAAPITGDLVRMINIDWQFSKRALAKELSVEEIVVVNDFAAVAHGLHLWGDNDLAVIGRGAPVDGMPKIALGPGSGLGIATAVPGPEGYVVAAGEGGHVALAGTNDWEDQIIGAVREEFGRCSAERVLSGPGLSLLYRAISRLEGRDTQQLNPSDITRLAKSGDATAKKAIDAFLLFLGNLAGDLALINGAMGGVYITGGIIPRLMDELRDSDFRQRFESKGRYVDYMKAIPTFVIKDPVPALRGLCSILGHVR